jgi:aryl-alcohol dehydrogenase
MRIEAAVTREANAPFRIESLELDDPRPNEVLIRIVAAGICHTDLAVVHQDLPAPTPIVLGHEGAGIVERIGSSVTHLAPGDHVVLTFPYCGECSKCRAGQPAFCEKLMLLAISGGREDGSRTLADHKGPLCGCFFGQSSFATHALAYANNTVKVTPEAPLEMLAPLGCGIQTGAGTVLNVFKAAPESSIAVFGCGAVGLAAVMAAKLSGCSRIIAVDRVVSRLEIARSVGATHTVEAGARDYSAQLEALGAVDYSVEASGNSRALESAVKILKPFGGTCAILGVPSPGSQVTFDHSHINVGRSIIAVTQGNAQPQSFIPFLVSMYLEGKLPLDKLIRVYDFNDINAAAADSAAGRTIKPVLRMPSAH